MLLSNYLEKSKETKAQILEHQRNSPRHSNFFSENQQNNKHDADNEEDIIQLPLYKSRKSSLPLTITVPTK